MAKVTGAQVMAEMLDGYGVTHIFMVPAVLRRTMAEIERRTGIKRIHAHGEKAAVYMADGYARASGRPGICMAQVVGAMNLAAGLRDPWLAHSPVIGMTGGREPHTKFRKVYQEIDDLPAFEPVTKWNATVDAAERFPDMLRQAFRVAVSGTPGPVHLQFRGNEGQVDAEEAEMEGFAEPDFARVPPFRPDPPRDSVRALLAVLQAAERPVIVAGGGVRASGAGAELVALAETLGIPVATSLERQGLDPGQSPAQRRRRRLLLPRERQPHRRRGRSRLLRRQRDRRHDDAFLGGAEDRHAGRADRHRGRGPGPQLPAQGGGAGRRQGGAHPHARGGRRQDGDAARGVAWPGARPSATSGSRNIARCCNRTPGRSGPSGSATS